MHSITFKVSDSQKLDFLWSLLNPNYNEEGGWAVEYGICEVYDNYAVAYKYSEGIYERVHYTKDDSTDSVVIDKKERCYILDVSENEKKALDTLRTLNSDTYELVDEKFASIEELNTKISEKDVKFEELNSTIATLTTERDEAVSAKESVATEATESYNALKAQYDALATEKETLTTEYQALVTYKQNIEDNEKLAIIDSYSDSLDEEALNQFKVDKDSYTAEELDMRLTYATKKNHPEMFSKQTIQPAYVPKDTDNKTGLESILSRYENKH